MAPWPARRIADPSKVGQFRPINGLLGHYDGDWYDNPETGGGVRLHMGEMCLINEASSSQLEWILNTYNPGKNIKGQQLKDAAISFREGLLDYMHESEHYKEFIVPFGRTYRGLMINQVCDKGWFQWISSSRKRQLEIFRNKYRIFFTAVQLWLDNPRKQEQIRDVGERLSKTEYEDDLDLQRDDSDDSDDTSDESDDDSRIDHDTDDEESEEWREDEDEDVNEDTLLDEDSDSEMMSLDGNTNAFTSHCSKTKRRLTDASDASLYTPTKRLQILSDDELSTSDSKSIKSSGSVQYDDDNVYSELDEEEQAPDITPKRHHTRSGQRFNFSSSKESLVEDAYTYKVFENSTRIGRRFSVVSSNSSKEQSQAGSPSPRNHPKKRRRVTITSGTEDETNDESDPEESIPLGVQFPFLRTPERRQRKSTKKNEESDSENEVTLGARLDDIQTPKRQRKTVEKDEDSDSEDDVKLGVRLDEMRTTSPRKNLLKVGPPWTEYMRRKALRS